MKTTLTLKQKKEMLLEGWEIAAKEMAATEGFQRMASGDITIEHYKAVMKQIYYQVRETPQLQGLAASQMHGDISCILGTFLKHAMTEVDHDQWVLNDLEALGVNPEDIKADRPFATTMALTSFPYHQLHHRNLWGYMGYIFHFEHTSTVNGPHYMEKLQALGVPKSALTFLKGHIEIDVMHNKMMDKYVDKGVTTLEDVQELIWGSQITARLYGAMITEAIKQCDKDIANKQNQRQIA